jgi:TonB family protein
MRRYLAFAALPFFATLVCAQQPTEPPPAAQHSPAAAVKRIRVAPNVEIRYLRHMVPPVYPGDLHIDGDVWLRAVIDRDGKVINLKVISGHPMLFSAAMEAAKQWEYAPYLLKGTPVEVTTKIAVHFSQPAAWRKSPRQSGGTKSD